MTDRDEVVAALQERAAAVLHAELTEHDAFQGGAVDSLAVIEWVMDLEDTLGVELTEADVLGSPTVGALADVILAKRA